MANTLSAKTYANLLTDLQTWLDRYDSTFVTQLATFIEVAQTKIFNQCPSLLSAHTATSTLTSSGADVMTGIYPSGWRATLSISYFSPTLGNVILQKMGYEYLLSYSAAFGLGDHLIYYADMPVTLAGTFSFMTSPLVPEGSYNVVIRYQGNDYINATNPQNMLTYNAYPLLLYGCLVEALFYLKDDERLPTMQALYQDQLKAFTTIDTTNIVDRAIQREKMD